MRARSLTAIRTRFNACCRTLGTKRSLHTRPVGDGTAHVEMEGGRYHYVVSERGRELTRRATESADELVYWLVSDVVFTLASDFEVRHRRPGEDFRRLLFARQIELMGLLDAAWAERKREEQSRVLAEHPYEDPAEG